MRRFGASQPDRPLDGKEQEAWLTLQESLESMPSDLPVSPGVSTLEEAYGPEWRRGVAETPSEAWLRLKSRIDLQSRMDRTSLRTAAVLGCLGGLALGVGFDALIRLVVS